MTKYDLEIGYKAVKLYLNGEHSSKFIVKTIVTNYSMILRWAKMYNIGGLDALKNKYKNNNYDLNFKPKVINYYQDNYEFQEIVAAKFNIGCSQVNTYVINGLRRFILRVHITNAILLYKCFCFVITIYA